MKSAVNKTRLFVPNEMVRMVRAALQGDFAGALAEHRRLYPLFKALFIEPNPVPVKTAMAHAGLISSAEVRAPLCEMTAANRQILLGAIASATAQAA